MNFGLVKDITLLLVAVATFFIGRQTEAQKVGREAGEFAKEMTNLRCDLVDLISTIGKLTDAITDLKIDLAHLEESNKSAHKRIDSLEKKVG